MRGAVLESILYDANFNKPPLFLFFLDISKAFDSMDRFALRIAMECLHLPPTFNKLITELFSNCISHEQTSRNIYETRESI